MRIRLFILSIVMLCSFCIHCPLCPFVFPNMPHIAGSLNALIKINPVLR
ncbi:MAG: hypothetical protein V1746_05570 [bacterium]